MIEQSTPTVDTDFHQYSTPFNDLLATAREYASYNVQRMEQAANRDANEICAIIGRINRLHRDILQGTSGLSFEHQEALRLAVVAWLDQRYPKRYDANRVTISRYGKWFLNRTK